MKVYLAVGHGVTPDGKLDPGAVSRDGRWNEQTAGDHVVLAAAAALRRWGVDVRHEADTDDPNFVGTTAAANEWGADLTVSVHHDWYGGVDAAFAFWYPGSTQGERAARSIVAAIGRAGFPTSAPWTKERGDLYLLRRTVMPAVLVECGRIGSALLDEEDELSAIGQGIARGIAGYLGVPTTAQEAPEGPYPDVDGDAVHADGIGRVSEAGIMGGYPDGTFRPGAPLTRGQAATIISRLLDYLNR